MDPPERPARRLRSRDMKRKAKDIVTVSNTPKKPRTTLSVDGSTELQDVYCWECHYTCVDEALDCVTCPRTFHPECLSEGAPGPPINEGDPWTCPVCQAVMKAECSETKSWAMKQVKRDKLGTMLAAAVDRMKSTDLADLFLAPVDRAICPEYYDIIFHPMDIGTLEKNVKKQIYASTDALMKDAEWIAHNSNVFNGPTSKITQDAKHVVKICKYEMSEIELCPDCYYNSTVRDENWFVKPCTFPHCIVWAKLKGFPYWPAKALRMSKSGNVDVRFFGAHDRSWLPSTQRRPDFRPPSWFRKGSSPLNTDPPAPGKPSKKMKDYDEALKEIEQHVVFLNQVDGISFSYAPPNTEFKADYLRSCPVLFGERGPVVTSGPRVRRLSGESVDSLDLEQANNIRRSRRARERSAGAHAGSRPGSAASMASSTSETPSIPAPPTQTGPATPNQPAPGSGQTPATPIVPLPATISGLPGMPQGPPGARYARRSGKLVIPKTESGSPSPSLTGSAPSSACQTPVLQPSPAVATNKQPELPTGVFEPTSNLIDLVSPVNSEPQKDQDTPTPRADPPATNMGETPEQPSPSVIVTPETLTSLERISQSLQEAEDTGSSTRTTPDLPGHTNNHVGVVPATQPQRPISAAKKRTLDSCIQKLKAAPSPVLGVAKPSTPTPTPLHQSPHASTLPSTPPIPPPALHGPGALCPRGTLPPTLHRPPVVANDHEARSTPQQDLAQRSTQDKQVQQATSLFMEKFSGKLKSVMDAAFAETLSTVQISGISNAEHEQQISSLKEDMKALRWMHHQSLNELRTSTRNAIAEAQSMFEGEKQRLVTEMKRQFDEELQKAVSEAKMKQWCANCGKEAVFYCCWNTSYCDYPCQQAHWPKHMETCGQIRADSGAAGNAVANQPSQRQFPPPHPPSLPQKAAFGSPQNPSPSGGFPQPPPYRKPPFNPPPTTAMQPRAIGMYGSGHLGLGMRRL